MIPAAFKCGLQDRIGKRDRKLLKSTFSDTQKKTFLLFTAIYAYFSGLFSEVKFAWPLIKLFGLFFDTELVLKQRKLGKIFLHSLRYVIEVNRYSAAISHTISLCSGFSTVAEEVLQLHYLHNNPSHLFMLSCICCGLWLWFACCHRGVYDASHWSLWQSLTHKEALDCMRSFSLVVRKKKKKRV